MENPQLSNPTELYCELCGEELEKDCHYRLEYVTLLNIRKSKFWLFCTHVCLALWGNKVITGEED